MARGRPREFDPHQALDTALSVFARSGFEHVSVQQLADAMGICKPSLYAAWGNKETLFIAAIRRYADVGNAARAALLAAEPNGARAIALLLDDVAQRYTAGATAGCLIVAEAASAQSAYSAAVRQTLAEAMALGHRLLADRLVRAQHDGHLDAQLNVEVLASYFGAVLSGISVQARNGATRAELVAVVRTAMRAWVDGPTSLCESPPSRYELVQ